MAHQECNLECIKQGRKSEVLEYVGPVKITLVDRSHSMENTRKIWYSAALTFSELLLNIVTTIVQFFTLSYEKRFVLKSLHILLGTIGVSQTDLFTSFSPVVLTPTLPLVGLGI